MRQKVGQFLSRWMSRPSRGRPPTRQSRLAAAVACAIEPLEERQMLTVTFDFQYGPLMTTSSMATMRTALTQAAGYVGSLFQDDINLKVDFNRATGMGTTPYTITTENFTLGHDTMRDLLIADRDSNEGVVDLLPTASQVSYDLPSGVTAASGITATRASLLALGVDGADLNSATSAYNTSVTDIDFSITLNALVNWDFDRSNGLTSGYYDFHAQVTQALFKGLGFISNVDVAAAQSGGTVAPTTLDLFRVAPGAAATDFTLASRVLTAGSDAVFYDGGVFDPASVGLSGDVGEVAMSTGLTGDGRAAASWKDDAITGKTMGLMDSTLPNGVYGEIRTTDLRALGLIGYDVNPLIPTLAPDGELSIVGTSGHDTLTISYGGLYNVWVNGAKTGYFNQNVSRIVVDAGAGNDTITHTAGNKPSTVYGGAGNDTIVGGYANDVIYGGDGDDHITGSRGSDFISGGNGIDTVTYADKTAGVNVSFDGVANDGNAGEGDNVQDDIEVLIGSSYNDTLNASGKSSGLTIRGGAGNDVITGSAFSDTLLGEDGNDTTYANDGVYDYVDGGAGIDLASVDLLVDSWSLLDILL